MYDNSLRSKLKIVELKGEKIERASHISDRKIGCSLYGSTFVPFKYKTSVTKKIRHNGVSTRL